MAYHREIVLEVLRQLGSSAPPLLQIIAGPRQVGKTTAALEIARRFAVPHVFAAADAPLPPGPEWIETQWRLARAKLPHPAGPVLLILDEVQKVRGWSETVKLLWDEECREGARVRPLLLGSSALLLQKGLAESLAGRFFLHPCMHWSLSECRAAFGWDLETWLYFGGYPAGAAFVSDPAAWKRYILDSLIETVLSRDVLQLQTVAKPALLRHLFGLACSYPAQVLAYNKMLGQLTDAGNTTTLAGYLGLLETAFLVSGLPAWSGSVVRKRASSPKLLLWNNALVNAVSARSPVEARADSAWRGRVVENAVGAHLLNHMPRLRHQVHYWREGHAEVDFVVASGGRLQALEVKSGRPGKLSGLEAFRRRQPDSRALVIGTGGVPLEEFFTTPPETWFSP